MLPAHPLADGSLVMQTFASSARTITTSTIELSVERGVDPAGDSRLRIEPVIDGVRLSERFDTGHGGFAGIVPANSRFGPIRDHYLGQPDHRRDRPQGVAVLDCDCAAIGCWPVLVQIDVGPRVIRWHDFTEIYRPTADHRLGPFEFATGPYLAAIDALRWRVGR